MPPEVTLIIYDEQGRERRVSVHSRRFTIGRLPENDLAIPDSNLSRRHALIENFDEAFFISDCGSQNGTTLNRKPVTSALELHDGDVITLGGAKDVVVQLDNRSRVRGAESSPRFSAAAVPSGQYEALGNPRGAVQSNAAAKSGSSFWLSTPVIAMAIVVVILLFTALFWGLSQRTVPAPGRNTAQENVSQRRQAPPAKENSNSLPVAQISTPAEIPATINPEKTASTSGDPANAPTEDLDETEKYALRVMRSISNDTSPTLSRQALTEVSERVKRYRGSSTVSDELRAMKQRGVQQLAPGAKRSDLKLPLVIFAALAKMDRDGLRGDAVQVAQGMLPVLSRLRVTFGTELANDSLLIVGAYDQGPGGTTHPLQATIFELAKRQPESPATIRTVWYLHEHQKLSSQAYDLVLRFLALGVIAQDPHKFGVDAEPLAL